MAETTNKVQYLDMEGLQLYDSLLKAKIAADIQASEYDDTTLKARVTANENAITTLNGEGEGSVKKQVDDAVARIVADAPEAYDTLREISDWISSHADSASAMNSQISTNKTDIEALKALVGELPDTAEAATIVGYIAEAIGASQTDLTSAIATAKSEAIDAAKEYTDTLNTAMDTRVKAVEDKVGDGFVAITEEEINGLFAE